MRRTALRRRYGRAAKAPKPLTAKKLDKEIGRIYHANCSGIQIPMMDIPKVFAAGRRAYVEGRDMKDAIVSYVDSIRVN
jgi:hypothetical protein